MMKTETQLASWRGSLPFVSYLERNSEKGTVGSKARHEYTRLSFSEFVNEQLWSVEQHLSRTLANLSAELGSPELYIWNNRE